MRRTGNIIVTSSDKIPTKRIVKVLGTVHAKKAMWISENPELCYEELKKVAGRMGADAVINVVYCPSGHGAYGSCNGIAVKLEEDSTVRGTEANASNTQVVREKEIIKEVVMIPCPYCGALMPQTSLFCGNCGARRKT